jgi:hypothetical protein
MAGISSSGRRAGKSGDGLDPDGDSGRRCPQHRRRISGQHILRVLYGAVILSPGMIIAREILKEEICRTGF